MRLKTDCDVITHSIVKQTWHITTKEEATGNIQQYCRYVMSQKRFLSKPKWGRGHKQSLGGTQPPLAPVATALVNTVDLFCIFIPDLPQPHFSHPCSSINLCSSLFLQYIISFVSNCQVGY